MIEQVIMEDNEIKPVSKDELKAILRSLKAEIKKLKKKLEKQHLELEDAADWEHLKQLGDSILAVQHEIKKGMKEHIIFNQYTQQEEIIKLNPKCNAVKNADLYFKKASKGKRGHEICEEKVKTTENEIEKIELKIEKIREVISLDENSEEYVKAAAKYENIKNLDNLPDSKEKGKNKEPKYPYRHYVIDGYDIYLGKNSTQNDELSTKFCKPWDKWLHVAGHAGSHCVIRMQKNAQQNPPKHVVEAAAAFSVYFSNAKNTSYADVHYTEGRYVRKRRKAPPGEVIAERCKNIRVAPINPQEYFKEA